MNKKTIYRDAPKDVAKAKDASEAVDDSLPPPEELLLRDETVKVTISLTQKSVDFFKKTAEEQGVPYQTMIRKVLDLYSQRYQRE
jgi:predicted DNA binding CopG/RHH family protein